MLQHEITFYQIFTNKVVTDYGILYFNPSNPQSYDSNHAHILNIRGDTDRTIGDIVRFYRSRAMVPRIYMSFQDNELDLLRPVLEEQGFTIRVNNTTFMLFDPRRPPVLDPGTAVRRVAGLTDDIIEMIYTDTGSGDYTVRVLNSALKSPGYHLVGLYYLDKCVSMASLQVMDGYSRIDDVRTHTAFRRRHFGTRLINYLAAYHRAVSHNYLYLYSEVPVAIHMYENAGFRALPVEKPMWSAWLPV